MTVFDYLCADRRRCSLLLGMWRGVVGEIIALVAWVLAFFAAKLVGGRARQGFVGHCRSDAALVAGWVTVFVAVLVAMALLRLAVRSLLKALGMTLSDRLLGIIFGVPGPGDRPGPGCRWRHDGATERRSGGVRRTFRAPLETAVLASKPWLPSEVAKRIRFG
jgi:membrane protein required for colicin V production